MLDNNIKNTDLEELKEKNILLDDEKTKLLKALDAMRLIISEINSGTGLDEVLGLIVKRAVQMANAEIGSLMFFNSEKEELYIKSSVGLSEETIAITRIKPGEGVAGWVFKEGVPLLVEDTSKDPRFKIFKGVDEKIKSIICSPLMVEEKIVGVINIDHRGTDKVFTRNDLRFLCIFADQAAIAIQNAQLHQEVKRLAITDGLTGLYNFNYCEKCLNSEIRRVQRYKRSASLIMADIDFFKRFNDVYGHVEGNKVLQDIARVLKSNVREVDVVGRYGGEEFIIILPETAKKVAVKIAHRIRAKVEEYNIISKKKYPEGEVTLSLGVAACLWDNTTDNCKNLLSKADQALYQAKRKGRNRVEIN